MVTIVNPVPHHSITREKICANCGVTLQYVPKDINTEKCADYDGGRFNYHFIVCPACNSKQTVKKY
jgi:Zn ribbon nucleic-acid-binding protein